MLVFHISLCCCYHVQCFVIFTGFPFSQDDVPTEQHKHSHVSGKPFSVRRGPGRPRKDRPSPRSSKKSIGLKLKGWKRYTLLTSLSMFADVLNDKWLISLQWKLTRMYRNILKIMALFHTYCSSCVRFSQCHLLGFQNRLQ